MFRFRPLGILALLLVLLGLTISPALLLRALAAGDQTTPETANATVQLAALAEVTTSQGTKYYPASWGAGTLVSSDGLILTSHHVVDFQSMIDANKNKPGVKILDGSVAVLIAGSPDEAPSPQFIAQVIPDADFPNVDLSLLQIVSDASGNAVDTTTLQLPFAQIGDSDGLKKGDPLTILGYGEGLGNPMIISATKVISTGTQSGVQGTAWIKVDKSINSGSAGGPVVDKSDSLVGISTLTSKPKCVAYTDTNGDRKVDSKDLCVPYGGSTNQLRPINLAKDLVGATSGESATPTPEPHTNGVQLTGTILDAETGRPIANATFAVLKEDYSWSDFQGDPTDDKVYDMVTADRNGKFKLDKVLKRGSTYSMGAVADGYDSTLFDGVEVSSDVPNTVDIEIKLQKTR